MRLSHHERGVLRRLTAEVIGADASISLYGSRVRDDARGGDIDLLVQSPRALDEPILLAARLEARAQLALGERKIDVLIIDTRTPLEAVHRSALREAVLL